MAEPLAARRSPYTDRSDDNLESIRLRFETFKAETMPTVDYFQSLGKCELIDTSLNRQAVFEWVVARLAEFTSHEHSSQPLTERSEILLGLRYLISGKDLEFVVLIQPERNILRQALVLPDIGQSGRGINK